MGGVVVVVAYIFWREIERVGCVAKHQLLVKIEREIKKRQK